MHLSIAYLRWIRQIRFDSSAHLNIDVSNVRFPFFFELHQEAKGTNNFESYEWRINFRHATKNTIDFSNASKNIQLIKIEFHSVLRSCEMRRFSYVCAMCVPVDLICERLDRVWKFIYSRNPKCCFFVLRWNSRKTGMSNGPNRRIHNRKSVDSLWVKCIGIP